VLRIVVILILFLIAISVFGNGISEANMSGGFMYLLSTEVFHIYPGGLGFSARLGLIPPIIPGSIFTVAFDISGGYYKHFKHFYYRLNGGLMLTTPLKAFDAKFMPMINPELGWRFSWFKIKIGGAIVYDIQGKQPAFLPYVNLGFAY